MWLRVIFEIDGDSSATHVGMEIPKVAIPTGDQFDKNNWHEYVTAHVFKEILRYVSDELMSVAKFKHENPKTT